VELRTSGGSVVDIPPAEILRAAGVIYASRRKSHGGPPLGSYRCRFCSTQIRGCSALFEHETRCASRVMLLPDLADIRSLLTD
jgi:hypothetical protein